MGTSIGIDIGSFSVKVAKVKDLGKSYELVEVSEYPLSQDPTKDNQLEIIEILHDIQKRYWTEGTPVVVGAHQFEVTLRRREFPFRERHKILRSLPLELEDEIPFSSENSIFDFKLTHFVGGTAHVLACACPKEHLIQTLKRFDDGGVQPDIVSVDGVSLANLFEDWREAPWEYPETTKTTPDAAPVDLIISIGHKTTTAAVVKDGNLLDLRLVDWGGKDIAETIANKYGMHYLEALKELRKKAFILTNNDGASREQVALSEILKSSIDVMTQKLRLALLEMKSMHGVEYRQAVLVGGVSQLKNLAAYLTQKLEVATNRLARTEMVPNTDFGNNAHNEVAAVTAIGLAIEGLKRPKNPALNLLKGEFAQQNQTMRLLWDKWGYTGKLLGIVFVALLIWSYMRDDFAIINSDVASEQLRTQAKNVTGSKRPNDRDIRNFIRTQEQKLKTKQMIEGLQNLNSPLDILKQSASGAPVGAQTGLNVFEFKVNSETVSIIGEARRPDVIENLRRVLQNIAKDKKVTVMSPPVPKTPGYRGFRFVLKATRRTGGP